MLTSTDAGRLAQLTWRLLAVAAVGVLGLVCLRVVGLVDFGVMPPVNWGWTFFSSLLTLANACLIGLACTTLGLGIASGLAARFGQFWRRAWLGAILALVVLGFALFGLATFFRTDQSPTRWPLAASYISDSLALTSLSTGCALIAILIIAATLRRKSPPGPA